MVAQSGPISELKTKFSTALAEGGHPTAVIVNDAEIFDITVDADVPDEVLYRAMRLIAVEQGVTTSCFECWTTGDRERGMRCAGGNCDA